MHEIIENDVGNIDPNLEILIDERIRNKIIWNEDETLIRSQREKWRQKCTSFNTELDFRMKKSMLGHFIHNLNWIQKQEREIQTDKINMYKTTYSDQVNTVSLIIW